MDVSAVHFRLQCALVLLLLLLLLFALLLCGLLRLLLLRLQLLLLALALVLLVVDGGDEVLVCVVRVAEAAATHLGGRKGERGEGKPRGA